MSETMKAVRIHAYGGPEVLVYEETPRPAPGEEELLIRVCAAGVNPADWKVRSGMAYALPLPLVLGWDVSGVVEAVGASVTDFGVGDEVWTMLPFPEGSGAYAEFVTCPASAVALKPHTLDHVQAAAVPLVALTAWQALFDAAGLSPGQTVLIHAAAGGVGHIAVQLAKWRGAFVIGTASQRNQEFLRSLGVDLAIDYAETGFETVAENIDVVLDAVGGETWERSWLTLKRDGMLVSLLVRPTPDDLAVRAARGTHILAHSSGAQLTELAHLVDAGFVRPVVDTVLPLDEVRAAHRLSEQGHTRGKIVLDVTATRGGSA
jgi:NADPH:quinone reductase-like Zn-dependent oxidoreductase